MNKIILVLTVSIFLISCSNPEPAKNNQLQEKAEVQSVKAKPVDKLLPDEYFEDVLKRIKMEIESGGISKIALITFEDVSPAARSANIGRTVSEYLYGKLAEDKSIDLAERSMMDKVLQELSLNMTGLIDAENAKQAGKIISADAIICGNITEIGIYFDINVRIIDVEKGSILSSAIAEIRKDVFITETKISGTDAGSIQAGLNALQIAVDLYGNMNIKDFTITYPETLEDLVPDYIDRIPDPVKGTWVFDKTTGKVSHSDFPELKPVNPRINNQTILNKVEKQKIISEMQAIKMSFLNEWVEVGEFPQDMGRVIKNGLRDSKPGEWLWDAEDFSVRHSKYSLPKMYLRKDGSTELVQ